jgi:hypothetical protein
MEECQMTQNPEKNPKPDSRNAKVSHYIDSLHLCEQLDYGKMAGTEGVDDEITLLRVKINSTLQREPDNVKLVLQIADVLSRLILARYNVTKPEKKSFTLAIKDVMKNIAVPIGIEVLKKKL